MTRTLRKGDRCPCCGQPIATDDAEKLLLLTMLAEHIPDYQWPEGKEEDHGAE